MAFLISESNRRRTLQQQYNQLHNIKPQSVYKSMDDILHTTAVADSAREPAFKDHPRRRGVDFDAMDKQMALELMRKEMFTAAEELEFEKSRCPTGRD